MDLPYWVYQDYFIFKPDFNGLIAEHIEIIKQYRKLIFSNYDDLKCIDSIIKNKKGIHTNINQRYSNFNQELTNLKYLTFGYSFDQQLTHTLDKLINLTHLTFSCSFNQHLTISLDKLINLTHLKFCLKFD